MARMLLKPPSCGVFFGNLHSKVTDRHLLELGTQAGPVHRASKAKDSAFGFVEYADVESAIYCVGLYHGLLRLFGQSVIVNFSNSPVGELKPQEQALLDRCIRAIDTTAAGSNAADSQYAGAGAVRRGGRDTQRYTPYGDARGHREQRAATRAPSRFNDDDDSYHDYGAYGSSDRYGQWPGHAPAAAAAQPPPAAHPPQPLGAGAVAAMQAAAAAAAAAAAGGLGQPPLAPVQQQQAGGWQVAPPAPAPAQHVTPQAVHVLIQQPQPPQQQQQPPPQPPPPQQQVYQIVQQAPPPVYTQPQQQYQQYQVVDPAAAAYQQWHQHQQQQQHYPEQQQYPQQQQYPPQHVQQYGAPAVTGGGFQTSMPPGLPGQQQQQQQHGWYQ